MANGDARQVITMLEATQGLYKKITIESLKNTLQSKHLRYDKVGEEHYNTISAFIKLMRASDVNTAIYYLARMIEAGEDPIFIARRMLIFPSEDVGMAVPTALVVANQVFRACETIGYPECAIAFRAAQEDVRKFGNLPIPMGLRNAPTKLMKETGYGQGESGLPTELGGRKYFLD